MRNDWPTTLRNAAVSGIAASALSTLVLALQGHRETGAPLAPINAVSHWFFGDKAAMKNAASMRYTATGLITHQLASLLWAAVFERLLGRFARSSPAAALTSGAATAALSAFVDYRLTPKRLTPGFELRLSNRSLVQVYAAFGLGLALAAILRR